MKKHRSYDVLISYPEDGGGGTKCISHQVKLPDGKYIVVGIGNELTDEQWSGIVDMKLESWWSGIEYVSVRTYTDYDDADNAFMTSPESGLSLIQHHGMKPNCVILKKQ